MLFYYRLDDNGDLEQITEEDHKACRETPNRFRVDFTEIGPVRVSTILLEVTFAEPGETPAMFETMVFDLPEMSGEEYRTTSLADAKAMHAATVAEVQLILKCKEI